MKDKNIDLTIYNQLVKEEVDVVGLIAYGLYKKDEFNYLKSLGNRKPSDDELMGVHNTLKMRIEDNTYIKQADDILAIAAGENASKQIQNKEKEIIKKIPSTGKTFVMNVISGIIAAILVTIIYYFGARAGNNDGDKTIDNINKEISMQYKECFNNKAIFYKSYV